MKQFKRFNALHDDYVHDIVYDHYGKRIATCSSDHKIKIWSEGADGDWVCDAELIGHRGAVWKLDWAHAEFGQVLASCSFDQQILIWEELDTVVSRNFSNGGGNNADINTDTNTRIQTGGDNAGSGNSIVYDQSSAKLLSRWSRVANLKSDSAGSVNDIKFAPRHVGLCLATCSADGFVRIFMVDDVMNLENWTLNDKFDVSRNNEEATCLCWNPSRFDSQMLVVGTAERAMVWVKNRSQRRWDGIIEIPISGELGVNDVSWAPNLGRSYHLIATAASNAKAAAVWKLTAGSDVDMLTDVVQEAELPLSSEVWRIKWNITGTVLATSVDDGSICLWQKNFRAEWNKITEETIGN